MWSPWRKVEAATCWYNNKSLWEYLRYTKLSVLWKIVRLYYCFLVNWYIIDCDWLIRNKMWLFSVPIFLVNITRITLFYRLKRFRRLSLELLHSMHVEAGWPFLLRNVVRNEEQKKLSLRRPEGWLMEQSSLSNMFDFSFVVHSYLSSLIVITWPSMSNFEIHVFCSLEIFDYSNRDQIKSWTLFWGQCYFLFPETVVLNENRKATKIWETECAKLCKNLDGRRKNSFGIACIAKYEKNFPNYYHEFKELQ